MNTEIKVQVRTVYGADKFYPANEQASKAARLLGQTTLTRAQLGDLRSMGFDIQVEHQTIAV